MAKEWIGEAAEAAPRKSQTVTEDNQQASTSGLKLHKLSLPTITGKYSERTPFSDTFNSPWTAIVRLVTFRSSNISSLC